MFFLMSICSVLWKFRGWFLVSLLSMVVSLCSVGVLFKMFWSIENILCCVKGCRF